MIWPDGSRFDGYFADNVRQGYGRMIYTNGTVYLGMWNKD